MLFYYQYCQNISPYHYTMSLVGPSPKLSSTDKIISTIQHKPYADNYSFYWSEAHSEVIFFFLSRFISTFNSITRMYFDTGYSEIFFLVIWYDILMCSGHILVQSYTLSTNFMICFVPVLWFLLHPPWTPVMCMLDLCCLSSLSPFHILKFFSLYLFYFIVLWFLSSIYFIMLFVTFIHWFVSFRLIFNTSMYFCHFNPFCIVSAL